MNSFVNSLTLHIIPLRSLTSLLLLLFPVLLLAYYIHTFKTRYVCVLISYNIKTIIIIIITRRLNIVTKEVL